MTACPGRAGARPRRAARAGGGRTPDGGRYDEDVLAAALAIALAASPGPAGGAAAAPAPAEGRLVDEVVAVVRNPASAPPRVVTLTKLVEEARVALVSRGATEAATGPLDRPALRAALEWLLDQMLVADEAAKLRLDELDRGTVDAELRRFQAHFPSFARYEAFLEASELSEDELLASLSRMLRVERYVQSRVGRAARVGEDEVDRWLGERGAAAAGSPARDAARAQLAEEKARAHVRDLLSELRGRAEIRVVGGLGRKDGGA